MSAVLLLFCGTVFCVTLMSYAFFWYETFNDHASRNGHQQVFSDARRWRSMIRGLLSGLLSLILVVLFYPLGYRRRLWESQFDPTCPLPPVILVHGLFHNPSAWIAYRRWLEREGFANVYVLSFNSWRCDFSEILGQLQRLIQEVRNQHPRVSVILIGHSLGGLLCRAYIEQLDDVGRVGAVVTLGAPHQGSKLTAFGVCALARSLAFRGPLIQDMERKRKTVNIPCLAVYSPVDNMVLPREALRVPYDGWDYYETVPMSHLSLLFHKPTAMLIINKIKTRLTGNQLINEKKPGASIQLS